MIVGLLMASLASAEAVENTPIHISSLLDVPDQSWEEEGQDEDMLQKHAQTQRNIRMATLYTIGAIGLGVSGYGFYMRNDALTVYDRKVLEFESLTAPEVTHVETFVNRYTAIAYAGLGVGIASISSGLVVQLKPTSMSVGFQF